MNLIVRCCNFHEYKHYYAYLTYNHQQAVFVQQRIIALGHILLKENIAFPIYIIIAQTVQNGNDKSPRLC